MHTDSLFPGESTAPPSSNGRAESELPKSIDSPFPAPARRSAPTTSHDAAHRIEGVTGERRGIVYRLIAATGDAGMTDDEGEVVLDWPAQSFTPRRNELARLGWVRDSGRCRPTRSGRKAIVWIASTPTTPAAGASGGSGGTDGGTR